MKGVRVPLRRARMEDSEVARLLDEIRRGSRHAFWEIVRGYHLSLRSYLAGQTYNMHDVGDLTQETFLAAFRNLHTFRPGEDFGA